MGLGPEDPLRRLPGGDGQTRGAAVSEQMRVLSAHRRQQVRFEGGDWEEARGRLVSGGFFQALGVAPAIGRLFTAADDRTEAVNTPFQVKIKKSGQIFDIPADRSIVGVLRDNGFEIETDCEDGYCGTCITRYLDGEPEHRDTVLGADERKRYAMICCARARSPMLVLDL